MIFTRWFTRPEVFGAAAVTTVDIRRLDYFRELTPPHRFVEMDVTCMDFRDDTFSVVICNNTLPYVPNVSAALTELARCLKPDGIAILVSHLTAESSVSVAEYRARHPELDDAYFAANGTAWVFGQDYYASLQAAGFEGFVDTLVPGYSAQALAREGLKAHSELTVGFKSAAARTRFNFVARVPVGEA